MTGPAVPVTQDGQQSEATQPSATGIGIGRAAALIGALTSIMVPVLARPAARSGAAPASTGQLRQTSSALLTWTTLILAPVSIVIAVVAGPLARLLNPGSPTGHCARAALVTVTRPVLAVFAPRILLYRLAVVLYGVLQAHRRFAASALAPDGGELRAAVIRIRAGELR